MRMKIPKIIFLAALTLGAAWAQEVRAFHEGGGGSGGGIPETAAEIARRVTYLTALLTLTPAQVSQATTIYTNAAATVTPLETSLDTARTSLAAAVKTNSTSTIDQLGAQIGTLTGQILIAETRASASFYALLTTAQRTIFDAADSRGAGRSQHD